MKWFYNNLADDATLTASSENTNFPLRNVQNVHLSAKFKTTGDTSEYIVGDLGSAQDVDAVCIVSNLTSGATLHFQMNSSDSWGSPPVDETITAGAEQTIYTFTSVNYRYFRFTFADASNPDGVIEVPRIFVGEALELDDVALQPDLSYMTSSRVNFSISGQPYGIKGVYRKNYTFDFRDLTLEQKELIDDVYEAQGNYKPFFVELWDSDCVAIDNVLYCLINENVLKWAYQETERFRISLNLMECK